MLPRRARTSSSLRVSRLTKARRSPGRRARETVQMTLIVFAFAVIMAIFPFAVDTSIGYIIQWLTKRG